jgi:hypothetical protein
MPAFAFTPPHGAPWRFFTVATCLNIAMNQYMKSREQPMLSEAERESVQQAIDCLNRVLESLLAQFRRAAIDVHEPVVGVTEALEHLEEIASPSTDELNSASKSTDQYSFKNLLRQPTVDSTSARLYFASVNRTASLVIDPFEIARSLPSGEKR